MKKFIGVPFSDQQNQGFSGANCYGLVKLFYREYLGIDIPELRVHSDHSNKVWATYLREINDNWKTVKEPKIYDVVAMAQDKKHPRIVQHVGIYLGNGKVLHTLSKINSHIVSLESVKHSIKGFHRWQS